MRQREKIEGTAFTRRKTLETVAETNEEILHAFNGLAAWSKDPWSSHRRHAEAAMKALEEEREIKPEAHRFEPRVETGWYLERLVMLAKLVQHHIDRGAPAWAAHEAALFGETWSELQLKLAREELYCKALEVRYRQATARPKPSAALRVARWQHYRSLGHGKTDADYLAAKDLGDGQSTVRAARTAWEKGAAGSD
jgi:hypothetical protein